MQKRNTEKEKNPQRNANDRNLGSVGEPQFDGSDPKQAQSYRCIGYHVNTRTNLCTLLPGIWSAPDYYDCHAKRLLQLRAVFGMATRTPNVEAPDGAENGFGEWDFYEDAAPSGAGRRRHPPTGIPPQRPRAAPMHNEDGTGGAGVECSVSHKERREHRDFSATRVSQEMGSER